jgi:hypothetical protein
LQYDKSPDGPFLGSRIGFGDTKKEGTETQSATQRAEITPDQRDETILEGEISLVRLQKVNMPTEAVGERHLQKGSVNPSK